ncbi:MoeA C-terminal region (domain IV) [Rhizoctonia solani]|uniref:MoeA C-terminal region (Domain IV) n=1 Tax=Rhizoctonia solani TaxID=456999 RepID=A0A8H7IJG8_9AGAM|nr:MoeA C-terminal region (domain IV) [Rhizoctonia solani]
MSATIQEPKSLGNFASGSGSKQNYPKIFVTRDLPNEDGLTVTVQDAGIRCIAANANAKDTLHPLRRAPNSILPLVLVVHEHGGVSLVSSNLQTTTYQTSQRPTGSVLESWVYSTAECGWVSSVLGVAVVLMLIKDDEKVWLSAVAVTSEDTFNNAGLVELEGVIASGIVGVACSGAGFLSVLQATGVCETFEISSHRFQAYIARYAFTQSIKLQGLITTTKDTSSSLPSAPLSIHSLKDSIVIVAGISVSSPAKLVLLMWEAQYSILLAERVIALPSPFPLLRTASVTLPRTSNIANALGAARSSSEWVIPSTMLQDDTRTALVNRIKQEVQAGRTAQADAAFFRWVENEAELSTEGDRAGTLASATKAAAKIPFPSTFATALIDAAFSPETEKEKDKEKDGPMFASGIVSALIWRGAAGQGMLRRPGGLYGALRQNREWPIMLSALQHVPDIPEDEIVATIRDLLIPFHPEESSPPRLMNTPPLQNALAHVLAYPTSPTPLRLALRTHLRDGEDLVHVLKVLDGWLKRGLDFDVWELEGLQPEGWAGSKNGKSVGVSAGTGKKKVKGAGMIPALEHIINFTQALLDTHLITLLQHRPSHALLRSLSATLSPLPAHNDTLSTLTAPLAQFAAEDALERKSELDSSKGAQTWQTKEEWRKRRKARLAAEAVAIGDYRFEELVL